MGELEKEAGLKLDRIKGKHTTKTKKRVVSKVTGG